MIDLLMPLTGQWSILEPDSKLSVNSSIIADYLKQHLCSYKVYAKDYDSLINFLCAGEEKASVICGSIYMIGKLRPYLVQEGRPIWKRVEK